jgi:tetratricopeptide (TPR) repeat protein
LARQLQNPQYITTALNNLGNVHLSQAARSQYEAEVADKEGDSSEQQRLTQQAEQQRTAARSMFEQAVQTSQTLSGVAHAQALLNLNRLLVQTSRTDQATIARNQTAIQEILNALPASRDKAYLLINLADILPERSREAPLKLALQTAQTVGDRRAESFALGSLGEFYRATQQTAIALNTLQQAQLAAQQVNAAESLYRWQWQTGRLLKAIGQEQNALLAYQQAIATLQSIRGDLLAANTDVQFDFRDTVEPVYRETMQLLLEPQVVPI